MGDYVRMKRPIERLRDVALEVLRTLLPEHLALRSALVPARVISLTRKKVVCWFYFYDDSLVVSTYSTRKKEDSKNTRIFHYEDPNSFDLDKIAKFIIELDASAVFKEQKKS